MSKQQFSDALVRVAHECLNFTKHASHTSSSQSRWWEWRHIQYSYN